MPGLLVAGLSLAANPARVAAAIAQRLARVEQPATALELIGVGEPGGGAAFGFTTVASPAIAARHQGTGLDPAGVVAAARSAAADQVAVISVPGGLLAPLTPRYCVRDLARELGFPLVLAAPSTPDAVNLVRLSAESARGAGLEVLAVVLSRWPTPPDRVMLDERRLLGDVLAGVELHTISDDADAVDAAARTWDWVVADEPAELAGAASEPVLAEVVLDPYTAWEATPVGDPRSTPRPRIMATLLEIVAAEGPLRATRAYSLYNRASGGKKLTTTARAPLSSAVHWLAQERKLLLTRSEEIPWQDDDLVRLPDAPAVRVRELGPRVLEEVPLDEIAELMRRLRAARGLTGGDELKRAALQTYGLVRLTARADEYLGLAVDLMDG